MSGTLEHLGLMHLCLQAAEEMARLLAQMKVIVQGNAGWYSSLWSKPEAVVLIGVSRNRRSIPRTSARPGNGGPWFRLIASTL